MVRLLLWLVLGTPHVIAGEDQRSFLAIRDEMLATGQFLDPDTGLPLAHRDPGYPLFLAALAGAGLKGLSFLWVGQILLSSLTGFFLFKAVSGAAGKRTAGICGALFLMQLSFASYSFIIYSETMACCLAGLLVMELELWRRRPGTGEQVAAGSAGAAAILTRATILLGIAGVIATLTRGRLRSRRVWLQGAGALLAPLFLWGARNEVRVGVPLLNTTGIFQLYMGNNPMAPLSHSHRARTAAWDRLEGTPDKDRARVALRLALESVVTNPTRVMARAGGRVLDALEGDRMLLGVARRGQFPERPGVVVLGCAAFLILITTVPTLLSLAVVLSPGPHWLAAMGRWMFLGLLLTQVLTIAHSRYSMPGWILLLPGAALMVERLRRGERAARIATGVSAVVLLAVTVRQVVLR